MSKNLPSVTFRSEAKRRIVPKELERTAPRLARWSAAWFTCGLTLASGALGFAPSLFGRSDPLAAAQWAAFLGLLAIGVVLLLLGLRQWSQLQRLGTLGRAVVIDETGEHWEKEDLDDFTRQLRRSFEDVRLVSNGDANWKWPLVGCPPDAWERHVSALTQTFLGEARKGGNPSGEISVFIYASWAVGLSWACRVKRWSNSPEFSIRQRSSRGRQGELLIDSATSPPISYMGRIAKNARYSVEARVVETSIRSTERRSIDEPTILLVRMTTSDWGTVGDNEVSGPLEIDDGANLGRLDRRSLEVIECRFSPPTSGFFQWSDFPALAKATVEFIVSHANPSGLNLLGLLVPPEVAPGIGILISRLENESQWPDSLWPVVADFREGHAPPRLVIAPLRLGARALKLRD